MKLYNGIIIAAVAVAVAGYSHSGLFPRSYCHVFISNSHTYVLQVTTNFTYALLLTVEHRPRTTCVYPALSRAAAPGLYLNPAVPFLSQNPSSRCSLAVLYFCGFPTSTVMLVWQYCHHFFSVCVQVSSISFFLAGQLQVSAL